MNQTSDRCGPAIRLTEAGLAVIGRGRVIAGTTVRRRLGYLPQNPGCYPGFTVAESAGYFALLKEVPGAQIPAAVVAAIRRVEQGGKANAKLRTLSGGMLRRAGIAEAIVKGTPRDEEVGP
jgi:ABC-type multidrug transport system ATPase subunit